MKPSSATPPSFKLPVHRNGRWIQDANGVGLAEIRASAVGDQIVAALNTPRSEIAVPDGWKLVPVDPTGDMIDAGGKTPKMKILDSYCSTAQLRGAFTEQGLAGPKSDCAIAQSYKAMLAAAPAFTRSAIAEKNPDPGTEKLLRDMLDRAYKMMQMAGYRVVEQDPDSNNPIIAWMADARSVLYGGTKPHPDPENLT